MDKRLISGDSGFRQNPADLVDGLVGRSLDGLDAILDNCLASIESDGECDRMINNSLSYLDDVTDGVQDGDQPATPDVILRSGLSSVDKQITATTNRLTDGRQDQGDGHDSPQRNS